MAQVPTKVQRIQDFVCLISVVEMENVAPKFLVKSLGALGIFEIIEHVIVTDTRLGRSRYLSNSPVSTQHSAGMVNHLTLRHLR